ncbi:D-alanyl-lipoteichoic acid biosynthesis protein DltD [Anoxybacillus sp. J5B_2022]|uniref:D-alanyl-lipoteichoic acid biosynthesis protein DltD n=1 Tax=Anoxybacillus sp. J5B_2022 TaxID=3003246 RepID=UPI002285E8F4|nr:D-alanyl-lipoteichoic acid biosynthesis protein DltD [Anoxybacillus sp. J5B_2022]MCZ0756471.1 D-alanyl-lipoteichoic acid biosynthesis protein DltD [Anoxybacillus sp. J5B_2022]
MKRPSFSPLIAAIVLFCFILFIPNQYLLPMITDKKVEEEAVDLDFEIFQGEIIQKKMLESPKYLPIYGSSELSRLDTFHPSNYFKVNPIGVTPFLVGRGGMQSFVHFLNFADQKNELKHKKLLFILSPQWFYRQGATQESFSANFSTLQAYKFALEPKVSEKLQIEGAKRLLTFDVVKNDAMLATLLKAKIHKDKKTQMKAAMIKPVAILFVKVLEKRDLLHAILDVPLTTLHPQPALVKNKTWDELERNAAEMAKAKSTNNRFYIDNFYYNKRIKPKIEQLRGFRKNSSLLVSPEYQDFQMVLDVLKEAKAKPLFVSVPVNGYWYDYMGLSKKDREGYYKKIKQQIEKEGFPVLDLSSHEYDPYFLKDTIHLGYKGWLPIDKAIIEFVHKY